MALLLSAGVVAGQAKSTANFQPAPGITVTVTTSRSAINYTITSAKDSKPNSIPLEIESQPNVRVQDFNFDGYLDFEVWYVDEGMGKYTVHRVFVFSPDSLTFTEALPKCGDEFLNLKVNKTRRALISTYYVENRVLTCLTRLDR
jgi:hypothetical protein